MQKAMTVYVKSLSKRAEGDDREKTLPGGHLGSSMVTHSEDFEPDSEFGNCLSCKCSVYLRSHAPVSNSSQRLAGRTSDLRASRRHMSRVLHRPGSRVWIARWPR